MAKSSAWPIIPGNSNRIRGSDCWSRVRALESAGSSEWLAVYLPERTDRLRSQGSANYAFPPIPVSHWTGDDAAMDNALDAVLVAAAGALDPVHLREMAANAENLAQLLEDTDEAGEAFQAAAALRGFAEAIDKES